MTEKAKEKEEGDCGIPNMCTRVVPVWLVALDNLPTMLMILLGGILLYFIWWPYAVAFLAYAYSSIVMFWGLICPYCTHYDTRACPCGYGVMSPKLFKARKGDFKAIFRQRLAIMYPNWMVPFVGGLYLVWTSFSWLFLMIFVAFSVIGFGLIPLISKFVGCADCEVKSDCPWVEMTTPSNT